MTVAPPPPPDVEALLRRLDDAAAGLRSTRWSDRVRVLGRVGRRFLDAEDPVRRRALDALPESARISSAQARWLLDGMAADWTRPRLETLVRTEFDEPEVLDRWIDDPRAPEGRRIRAFPLAPGTALHICAGSVPGVSVTSLIRGLLVGGPVLLKAGSGDTALPRLFMEALDDEAGPETTARAIADAAAVAYWPGGGGGRAETAAFAGAGSVVVYGGTSTVAELRARLPPTTPLVEYGHHLGVAVVDGGAAEEVGSAVAAAVAAFDQRGCVSPHQLFVIGDPDRARTAAETVAEALGQLAEEVPPGPVGDARATEVQQLRGAAEMRAAAGEAVRVWSGPDVSWTVILDAAPELRPSCLARTLHVTPLPSLDALESVLAPVGGYLQTVGIAGFDDGTVEALAERVGRWGASRIVPVARMSFPPAWWLHDGQGPLRRLIRWCARGPA